VVDWVAFTLYIRMSLVQIPVGYPLCWLKVYVMFVSP
jgi:hypothetical protein